MTAKMAQAAFVSLIGAGPGDPGLLTLRGKEALEQADVVLFDYLANAELLQFCPQAETIYVGKKGFSEYISQEQINALLVQKAQENGGQRVARLKGGDVFVFGRGGEEAEACLAANIPFEIVPGISSALAAPAYAGIPVTHRATARSFAVITGNTKEGGANYGQLAGVDTLLLLMGVRNLDQISNDLIQAGRAPDTPAATIQWGTTTKQKTASGTLSTIAQVVKDAGLEAPAVTVVGQVAELRDQLQWFEQQKPLLGRKIAITRTRNQASTLSRLLRARGAEILEVPLIHFARTSAPEQLHQQLRDLSGVHWLVLSSNQAVVTLFEHLNELGLDARHLAHLKLAAVGPSTARSLAEHGLRADFVPQQPGAKYLGAELPARPEEVLLHLTSQLAEDALEQALEARGLSYRRAELYRTEPAQLKQEQLEQLSQAEAITLASGSAAKHLAALASDSFDPLSCSVVVMGPQTAEAAKKYGFAKITMAQMPSLAALAEAVRTSISSG